MLQAIINALYRYPKSNLKKYQRFGGYFNYRKMMQSRAEMEAASCQLPPVRSYNEGLAVYFLTGKHYLYQTLFCITSLQKHCAQQFHFILVDDGTFDEKLIAQIHTQLPDATIITKAIIEQHINAALPESEYPVLRHKRKVYPHIKKLTDIHTLPGTWKLVLDSDMLFAAEPEAMINWLKKPSQPLHMVDCMESYGYTAGLMGQVAGTTIKPLINVGAIGLNSEVINWRSLETRVKMLEGTEGTSYYLEQALTAMLIGNQPATVLEPSDYIVNPDEQTIAEMKGVLHHYVDLSKAYYYKTAWRKFI